MNTMLSLHQGREFHPGTMKLNAMNAVTARNGAASRRCSAARGEMPSEVVSASASPGIDHRLSCEQI